MSIERSDSFSRFPEPFFIVPTIYSTPGDFNPTSYEDTFEVPIHESNLGHHVMPTYEENLNHFDCPLLMQMNAENSHTILNEYYKITLDPTYHKDRRAFVEAMIEESELHPENFKFPKDAVLKQLKHDVGL